MGKNRRYGTSDRLTRNSPLARIDLSAWPAIDEGALKDERRKLFLRKKHGITLYLSGASASQIKQSTGFSIAYVYRMVTERCLETHEDGQLYGWRGIIPHARLRPYTRLKRLEPDAWGKGSSGALQLLFASESGRDLERRFERLILRKFPQKPLEGERKPKQDLIVWFLEEAAKLSPEARASWPFTAAKQGQVTISKHIDKVLERHPDRARAVLGGPEATRKARAGDGTNRPAFRPFQRVECDAYKTDTRCVVLVPSHAGGWEPVLVHRIWVIVILEVSARCVLGYAVSVRREPSADDVLRAMKCALTQWSPRKLSFSDVAYVPGGGLPSFLGSKYCGACWDEFSVDGVTCPLPAVPP